VYTISCCPNLCGLFSSTQPTFTKCSDSVAADNYCTVSDPFKMFTDGWVIIKVNGSNAVASTSTGEHRIQLHGIGKCIAHFWLIDGIIQFLEIPLPYNNCIVLFYQSEDLWLRLNNTYTTFSPEYSFADWLSPRTQDCSGQNRHIYWLCKVPLQRSRIVSL